MGWPKGKRRGPVEQGNAAPPYGQAAEETQEEAQDLPPDEPPSDLEGLRAWAESLKLPCVVVELTHPEAVDRAWDGKYSGYPQKKGDVLVRWNDGSTYPAQ